MIYPVRHRPLCGSFAEAVSKMKIAKSDEDLRNQLGSGLSSRLYDPDPDRRINDWKQTWMVHKDGDPLAFADREICQQ